MDELVGRIATKTGVDSAVVRKSLAIIIAFLLREAPAEPVDALASKLPGARELAAEAPPGGSGLLGLFNDLTGAGLGMSEIQGVAREFVGHARAKLGAKEVDELIATIPGLSQFV